MPHDILVVGAGPAGLSTALHLARFAPHLCPRILVLEKAHHPRHKLCAGALTSDAEVVLQRLGLDVTEVPHVDASAAYFDFRGRGLHLSSGKRRLLRIIRRNEFDAWLADKARQAGINIREGVIARRVVPAGDYVRVETDDGEFRAAIVVGADGSNGITRRCILPGEPIHTARALEVLLPVSVEPAENGGVAGVLPATPPFSDSLPLPRLRGRGKGWGPENHRANVAYFDFAPVPLGIAGYTWDFPTQSNGRLMRCWGIYDTNLLADRSRPALKETLAAEMEAAGLQLDEADLQGHPIRWFTPRSQLSTSRVILVGDAAGTDGIFGEGISIALGYGRVAAQAIMDAIATNDFAFSDYRRRVFRSPLGQALTIRTAITNVLYRLRWVWFQAFFWRVLKPVVAALAFVLVLNWARRMK